MLGISLQTGASERESFKSSCRDDMVQISDAEWLGKYARNAQGQPKQPLTVLIAKLGVVQSS
jgi:hypothetical protein